MPSQEFTAELAPGAPGIPPRWTSSAKDGVGTAISGRSRVWFTLSHGILNEVYYPRLDQANVRDFGFLVGGPDGFFSEEKRDTTSVTRMIEPGVPAFQIESRCNRGAYVFRKTVLADPRRDGLLQRVEFEAIQGARADYRLYALLAPHLGNRGYRNTAWCGEYKGLPVLWATGNGASLALMCSNGFPRLSSGYVGFSDGWQDISLTGRMTRRYKWARDGNVALTGEVPLDAKGAGILALGFGRAPEEAAQIALASLYQDFDEALRTYTSAWRATQARYKPLDEKIKSRHYRTSTAVLRTHEDKQFPGAMIASLSIPWGFNKGDDDLGGYHLVWPRDLVESASAMLAAGDHTNAEQTLLYLMCTQEADGRWPQNMWMNGTPYWNGLQLDEIGLPVLLAEMVRREAVWKGPPLWPMVRRAIRFIVAHGPATDQDRWEEDAGYSPYSLAVVVAALLAAADFADDAQEREAAQYLRETADLWNEAIERLTYVTGTEISDAVGVEGYYVRIAVSETPDACPTKRAILKIRNRTGPEAEQPAWHVISPDALALVRFGLRSAHDPKIVNTVRVIDALLRTPTATGPVWHRYNGDGYGEHEDGSPFDGTGVGRGWPLLAGERAHYELAAGNFEEARRLLEVMEAQVSYGGLFPEQVWDASDVPERELFNGRPAGSAMPLVWAHAEYIKLLRSLTDGKVYDLPPQASARYKDGVLSSPFTAWRPSLQTPRLALGRILRIELPEAAMVVWSVDAWTTTRETPTLDTTLGVHSADLPTAGLPTGARVEFTFHWNATSRWENQNHGVEVRA